MSGHLDDYESYNPAALSFVRTYAGKTSQQIRADGAWQDARARKPKRIGDMSPADKIAFKQMLNQLFPPNPAVVARAAAARPGTGA